MQIIVNSSNRLVAFRLEVQTDHPLDLHACGDDSRGIDVGGEFVAAIENRLGWGAVMATSPVLVL